MTYHAGDIKSSFINGCVVSLLFATITVRAQEPVVLSAPGLRVVAVHSNPHAADAKNSSDGSQGPALMSATPFPRPPLSGFLPLVAATLSDKHKTGDLVWAHVLETLFIGASLNPPSSTNWVFAVADSGSTTDAVSYCDSLVLGLSGSNVTANPIDLSGIGGDAVGLLSYPRTMFVAPLSAIGPGNVLDTTQLIGHSHVSMVVFPPEECIDNPLKLPSLLGNEFLAYYNTIVRNDLPQHIMLNNEPFVAPLVTIQSKSITLPVYPRKISLNTSPSGLITSSYYGDIFGDFRTPITPTVLAADESAPIQGAFFSSMGLLEGTAGPTNPIQNASVLVDTGAQSTIITNGMAANLNLPVEPDFTVLALGIAGTEVLPGYYIDYVKINALGGALEFSQVPVLVWDPPAWPDGGMHDGIMGMNLFWNRNVILQPELSGSGFLHVGNPIAFAFGDFNRDFHVDGADLDFFKNCVTGPGVPQTEPDCIQTDHDTDGDVDQDDFAAFQRCYSGPVALANTSCQ